jgi:hypothetical protein
MHRFCHATRRCRNSDACEASETNRTGPVYEPLAELVIG